MIFWWSYRELLQNQDACETKWIAHNKISFCDKLLMVDNRVIYVNDKFIGELIINYQLSNCEFCCENCCVCSIVILLLVFNSGS